MSSPRTAARPSVETHVAAETPLVEFLHRLGGDVDVVGYDAEGAKVQLGAVIPVSDDEVVVHVHPGQVARLVATLADPDEDESPTREGMHVRH